MFTWNKVSGSLISFIALLLFLVVFSLNGFPDWVLGLTAIADALVLLNFLIVGVWSEYSKPFLVYEIPGGSDRVVTLKNAGIGHAEIVGVKWSLKVGDDMTHNDPSVGTIRSILTDNEVVGETLEIYNFSSGGAMATREAQVLFKAPLSQLDKITSISAEFLYKGKFGRTYKKIVHVLTEPK